MVLPDITAETCKSEAGGVKVGAGCFVAHALPGKQASACDHWCQSVLYCEIYSLLKS